MIVECSKCGAEVERDNANKKATCFNCKKERKRKAAKKQWKNKLKNK